MNRYDQEAFQQIETEWRYRCNAIKLEADYWRLRHDAVLDMIVKNTLLTATPKPMMMADSESYELGKLHGSALERNSLESLEADAHSIFNNPPGETSQDVRDVIEWYSASIRARGHA